MLSHCSIYISDLTYHLKTWLGLQETVNHHSLQCYFCPLASITKGANFYSSRLPRCIPLYAYPCCMGVSLKNDVISSGVCHCFCIRSAGRAPLNFCSLACCISVGWQTLPRFPPQKMSLLLALTSSPPTLVLFWSWHLLFRRILQQLPVLSGKCK